MHPEVARALVGSHMADLLGEAERQRLARIAREARTTKPHPAPVEAGRTGRSSRPAPTKPKPTSVAP
jgi:hypothetical protein